MVFDPLGVITGGILCYGRTALMAEADKKNKKPYFKLVYRPANVDIDDFDQMSAEADLFCRLAWHIGAIDLFFDEIDSFAKASQERSPMIALINWGRNKNISVIGTVRRPSRKIPRDWITEITKYSIFQTRDPYDVSAISNWTGIEPEKLRSLEKFEYIEWDNEKITSKKCEIMNNF